ncbi:hypothetical protein [Micromonospora sp. RTGN7]|uniref:hypothetical protein n=1 Tax=Micromonospora sp. RTGN7 TaxID=3016526 RepID=UPI0029FF5543|nr:hypothetical protein [Micromonospora sp. RTGN7]
MKLLTRPKLTPAELAQLRQIELHAQVEHERQVDQLRREQHAADRAEQRRAAREHAQAEKRHRKAKAKSRARRLRQLRRWAATARTVGPLLLVNSATVGGQLAYAYDQTPAGWHPVARAAVAIGVATAAESVALYVGWHAHDALLAGARTTAARLRRASYGIALVMALVNYSHFADALLEPTALAVILGVLSSLSPWLWGLHTRRAQHVQLVREDLVDVTGATFDPARRRAFPFRSWLARRWSIDQYVREPRAAWEGYRAHRAAQRAAAPTGRIRAAWRALLGRAPAPTQPEPAEPEPAQPAPVAEPLSLDDPDVLLAARARIAMADATQRIRAGAARVALADRNPRLFADLSAGGLWDLVAVTDEPAHVRRPARAIAEPVVEPPSTPDEQGDEPDEQGDEPDEQGDEPAHAPAGVSPAAAARLAAMYDKLVKDLRREPYGSELAHAAGMSRATANRWKARRERTVSSRGSGDARMPEDRVRAREIRQQILDAVAPE